MSIIIKTPQPDTEERLVLVPPESVSRSVEGVSQPGACDLAVHTNNARDATPADLARGGYERLGPEVLRVSAAEWRELKLRAEGREAHGEPGTLAHLRADLRDAAKRAEHAEQLTSELQATIARAFSYIEHTPGVQYLDAEVKKLGERAEKAEGLLIQRETELRLAREDGDERARDLRQAYERAVAAAEKAERERDEALGRAQSETEWRVRAVSERQDAEAERDTARAELARLTAPGEGEPTDAELLAMFHGAEGNLSDVCRALWRRGVAHERARQPEKGRATDEELVAIAETAYEAAGRGRGGCVEAAALAVAARVRQECLVAQAVALKAGVSFWHCDAGYAVQVSGRTVPRLKDAEVPATLARLLGEVSRG